MRLSSASGALAAVTTRYPTTVKSSARFSRTPSSSSTIRMDLGIVLGSGGSVIIIRLARNDGGRWIYTGQLRRVDKHRDPSRGSPGAVVHGSDNTTAGKRRSENAWTTRHARWPASVTA